MATPKGKVITGSRVKLQLAGHSVGYATIASYVETLTYDPVAVLDQMEIAEHVPVAYDVAFTASRVFMSVDTLKSMTAGNGTVFPKFGTDSATFLNNILKVGTSGEMTAQIVDQKGGTLVQLLGVKVTSHNLTFGARAVVGEDVSFVAIRALDKLASET